MEFYVVCVSDCTNIFQGVTIAGPFTYESGAMLWVTKDIAEMYPGIPFTWDDEFCYQGNGEKEDPIYVIVKK